MVTDSELNPVISIIIPTFNREAKLNRLIESLQQQSVNNWECIIVDDGSTDNTLDLLKNISSKDLRFKFKVREREPKGAPTCRNIGASIAQAKHLLFFDSDDLFFPWAIEELTHQLTNFPNEELYIYQQIVYHLDADRHFWWRSINTTKNDYLRRLVGFEFSFSTHSVIWNKAYFQNLNEWNEGLNAWQDPPLHIKALVNNCKLKWIGDFPLAIIIQQNNSDQISARARTANFNASLKIAMSYLPFEIGQQFKHSIFQKVWSEATFYENYKSLLEDLKGLKSSNLISGRHFIYLKWYFSIYFHVKNMPLLYRIYYRLKKKMNQRQFFVKVYPNNNELLSLIKRIDQNQRFKSFVETNYGQFLNQLHEQTHQ